MRHRILETLNPEPYKPCLECLGFTACGPNIPNAAALQSETGKEKPLLPHVGNRFPRRPQKQKRCISMAPRLVHHVYYTHMHLTSRHIVVAVDVIADQCIGIGICTSGCADSCLPVHSSPTHPFAHPSIDPSVHPSPAHYCNSIVLHPPKSTM